MKTALPLIVLVLVSVFVILVLVVFSYVIRFLSVVTFSPAIHLTVRNMSLLWEEELESK